MYNDNPGRRMKQERFEELIEQKHAVTITPKYPPYDTMLGFPLAVSSEMLLLHEVVEFHLAGYAIMPLGEIRAVRSKKAERKVESILHAEKSLDALGIAHVPPMDDYQDLFRFLQKAGKMVQVEFFDTADPGYTDEAFAVGKITGHTSRSVAILNFDATGAWDSEPTVIAYDQVKRIRLETEYIRVFGRYLG